MRIWLLLCVCVCVHNLCCVAVVGFVIVSGPLAFCVCVRACVSVRIYRLGAFCGVRVEHTRGQYKNQFSEYCVCGFFCRMFSCVVYTFTHIVTKLGRMRASVAHAPRRVISPATTRTDCCVCVCILSLHISYM